VSQQTGLFREILSISNDLRTELKARSGTGDFPGLPTNQS
jgi:hypothetical protein